MSNGRLFWGVFLVVVGSILFLHRVGIDLPMHLSWKLWPLILVFWGIATLVRVRLIKTIAIVLAALCSGLIVSGTLRFHDNCEGECFDSHEPEARQMFVTPDGPATSA